MGLTNEIFYLKDFGEEARKRRAAYGRTGLFSTGVPQLDTYLGGGFGREHGYEIILLFGPTKIGKSTIALNLVAPAIKAGKRVGLMVLEDEGPDTYIRLTDILGPEATANWITHSNTVRCLPADAMLKSWGLDDLLKKLESWFEEERMDLVLLDHIQFAFENADTVKGENEYIRQRAFMQKLNHLMKKTHKTLILVSHIGKNGNGAGGDKIVGSSSIPAAATKIIEVKKDKLGMLYIQLHGSRFTRTPDAPHPIALTGPNQSRLQHGSLIPSVDSGV